ncbi:MAG: biopolymer transporter ExbD [Krumholzibacteria bacterium]|nr:biopolymer transporter ExbD [Candidatus Krumholzibacteria bacterium]
MIDVKRTVRGGAGSVDINMGPLIDMVFLLLIFFVVTTSFVKETGIEVQRSTAATAQTVERGNVLLAVSAAGEIFYDGRRIDVRSVRAHVERALAEDPEAAVVVVADKDSATGVVVQAMDQCRLAGATSVSLAASREGGP